MLEEMTVKMLQPEELCEHFKLLGDLITWQTTVNMGTGSFNVIPTLDKGRGKNRMQAVMLYCPLCAAPTFRKIEPHSETTVLPGSAEAGA
jgi:hypothetical protein